jgi:hypothetical protein
MNGVASAPDTNGDGRRDLFLGSAKRDLNSVADSGAGIGIFGPSCAYTPYYQTVLNDAPVSCWRLDETSGTTAADAVDMVRGTYVNGPTLGATTTLKNAGTAVSFDGNDRDVGMGDVYDFIGATPFSIELWYTPTSVTGARGLVSKLSTSGGNNGWLLRTNGNVLEFSRYSGGAGQTVSSATTLSTGTTYHIVATYDGTNSRLYLNGVLDATNASAASLPNTAAGLEIGRYDATFRAAGTIDEVALYRYALGVFDAAAHYDAGRP